jgi:hypothetical protein
VFEPQWKSRKQSQNHIVKHLDEDAGKAKRHGTVIAPARDSSQQWQGEKNSLMGFITVTN